LGEGGVWLAGEFQAASLAIKMSTGTSVPSTNVERPSVSLQARADLLCGHDVQFYCNVEFLLDSLVPFIGNTLETGGAAVVVATKAHRDRLAHRLEARGIGLAAAVQDRRYIALDAAETLAAFTRKGLPDARQFTEVIGGVVTRASATARSENSSLAIFGEMVSLLWQEGNTQGVIELERLWNDLSRSHRFALRCGYPLGAFNREEHKESFSKICGEHHSVIPAESYTTLVDEEDRLRLVARWQQTEQALKTESLEHLLAQNRNRELLQQVRRQETAEEELRRFARRLLSARDEEQRRIASELHENTAQVLAALSMYFSVLQEEKDSLSPRAARVVASSRKVTENLLKQVRKLSYLLHPPTLDDVGLRSALREYVEHLMARSSMRVELQIAATVGRLPRKLEIALFRMVEAVLADISLHSHGSRARVSLSRASEKVLLEIHDYGDGTPNGVTGAGSGITGMRERAVELGGSITIRTDHEGTLISVTLPAEEPAQA
jgi:signal transduction histidine kinase